MIATIGVDQLDLIEPLWRKLDSLHQDLDVISGYKRQRTTWEQRRLQLAQKAQGGYLFQIARTDEVLFGYCFTSLDDSKKGEVDSLFILPEFHGRGFGTKFMEHALDWLRQTGCKNIEIWVHTGNTRAIEFYWRFGFATGPTMTKWTNHTLHH